MPATRIDLEAAPEHRKLNSPVFWASCIGLLVPGIALLTTSMFVPESDEFGFPAGSWANVLAWSGIALAIAASGGVTMLLRGRYPLVRRWDNTFSVWLCSVVGSVALGWGVPFFLAVAGVLAH